jgi:hypothetical protein
MLLDERDPKCILIGRTGSGKTALIKYIVRKEECVKQIDPEAMALRHLSNSTIVSYFTKLGVNMALFYKVLWRHVFIVELIKLRYDGDMKKSRSILDWKREKKIKENQKRAIDYLEKWEDKFWEDTEYRIRELERSLESRFKAEFGGNVDLFNMLSISGKTGTDTEETERVKYEVVKKAQKVISESQIEEIGCILELMKNELFEDTQRKHFIVIDDLDKDWVSEEIVYEMIQSLIDTIKEMSAIKNVKVVIALRTNILKKVFKQNRSRGVQREKYTHLFIDMQWTKQELEQLVNNRLNELMKGEYTKQTPSVTDVFYNASKKHESGFEYVLERTLYRPRDVIDYVNKCIKNAEGKTQLTRNIVSRTEKVYSETRLQAIYDEWMENYGNLHYVTAFLRSKQMPISFEQLVKDAENYFLEVMTTNKIMELKGEVKEVFDLCGQSYDYDVLAKNIIVILYEVGVLGVKLSSEHKMEYVYQYERVISVEEIEKTAKVTVHPMLKAALKILS